MKQKLFYYLCCLIAAAGLYGCSSESTETPEPPQKSHTLVFYMMGADNGLADFMDKNIRQILTAMDQIPENGRVALFYDRGNYTRLTELTYKNGITEQKLITEFNPGTSTADPTFMKSVFDQIKQHIPSDTYGLVFSSHGGGWVPASVFDEHISDQVRRRSAQPATRFFGQDKNDCLELPQIATALEGFNPEYILFDACFMASVEGLYDLRKSTPYVIASPAEVIGNGFAYQNILGSFFNGKEGLENICRQYMQYYRGNNADWVSATISLIDMTQLDQLALATREVYQAGFNAVDASQIQAFEGMPVHCYFDFEQYIQTGCQSADAVRKFQEALKKTVLFTDYTPTIYSDYGEKTEHPVLRSCGLTCHIAQESRPRTEQAYWETEWARFVHAK